MKKFYVTSSQHMKQSSSLKRINKDKPLISIVICTKNRADSLQKCLNKVFLQDYNPFEVIILDNGSHDETKKIAQEFYLNNKNLRYYYYPRKGFANFRQFAWNKAKGQIITSLDDDCIIDRNFLDKIEKTFSLDKKIGIVGGNVINIGFSKEFLWKGLGTLDNYGYFHNIKNRENATIFGSANLSIRKDIFNKIGGFDLNFSLLEEADICYNVKKEGYSIKYNPRIKIKHYHTPKNESITNSLKRNMDTKVLRFYLYLKYFYKPSIKGFYHLILQEVVLLLKEIYESNITYLIKLFFLIQEKIKNNKSGFIKKNEETNRGSKTDKLFELYGRFFVMNYSIIFSRILYPYYFMEYIKYRK